ncbi:MAG: hypothetical protein IPH09_10715 [bacterium]|nr:hypothetical protein [bacterium]
MGPFTRFGPPRPSPGSPGAASKLRAQPGGHYFQVTDSSRTVVDALLRAARRPGVGLRPGCGLRSAARAAGGGFVQETDAGPLHARALPPGHRRR